MAFFAKLDDNNNVLEVNVIDDQNVDFLQFPASEPVGIQYLTQWSGGYSNWKQTSEIRAYRKNYAATGFSYSPDLDAFIPPKPYPSWILDTDRCVWNPPIPYPNDGKLYIWNESTLSWEEVTENGV